MKTIEFISTIKEGVIRLPSQYDEYNNQEARVIVLLPPVDPLANQKERLSNIFKKMEKKAMFSRITNPVAWQKKLWNKWD